MSREDFELDCEQALSIIHGAMDDLVGLMPPIDVARVMAYHSILGLTRLGGYEEVVTITAKAVAKATEK